MKCINCGTDNKLKDRTANQGRCLKCNHLFAFEPTSMLLLVENGLSAIRNNRQYQFIY